MGHDMLMACLWGWLGPPTIMLRDYQAMSLDMAYGTILAFQGLCQGMARGDLARDFNILFLYTPLLHLLVREDILWT